MPQTLAELQFLSTPSARRATIKSHSVRQVIEISIHALREEGDFKAGYFALIHGISIHALREEGDVKEKTYADITVISIHALREEGDALSGSRLPRSLQFLSTPSARRATRHRHRAAGLDEISIHALREEGDKVAPYVFLAVHISIHALREEGDVSTGKSYSVLNHFYPRPPRGGRPKTRPDDRPASNFYPRPPRGGRPTLCALEATLKAFLSTPSARRATISRYQ